MGILRYKVESKGLLRRFTSTLKSGFKGNIYTVFMGLRRTRPMGPSTGGCSVRAVLSPKLTARPIGHMFSSLYVMRSFGIIMVATSVTLLHIQFLIN